MTEQTLRRIEKIAYCGEGHHKLINIAMHTFPMGNPDPETTWKLAFDKRCERCELRLEAAIKAYNTEEEIQQLIDEKVGLYSGRNSA